MAATDTYSDRSTATTSPVSNAAAVSTSDTTTLTYVTRALYIGTGGDVSVEMNTSGSAVVFKNVPSGTVLPIRVSRVNTTSTTASNIVALW